MSSEIDQYDYELPRHLIAQEPVASRVDARLLVVDRRRQTLAHHHIRDLPELLAPGDCLVLNDTRVVPARLLGRRESTGGHWEGLFLEADHGGMWHILCKARGKLFAGEWIRLTNAEGQDDVRLQLAVKQSDASWIADPDSDEETFALLDRIGRVPLPPYIRKGEMVEADRRQYQTVYARSPGAVAAPTAGLHFSESLLRRLAEDGITICPLTLHTGAGTFRPISAPRLAEHRMHSEWGTICQETVDRILHCRQNGGRVVAVGTTSVRLLETAATGGTLKEFSGHTDLFIRPPFEFNIVDAMLTNFHLPRTTLLVLVRTFGGDELIARAYAEAIRENYRFYSYGDAMLIV
jgi:S-adenosylmethionine:tRNA ribosyltransferase-isomerase